VPEYASWSRRVIALVLDWAASTLVTVGVIGPGEYRDDPSSGWVVLGVFALEASLLTALAGGSFGQLLVGVRVLSTDGRPLGLLPALARTLLVCLVVPPLVYKPETGRGLHDLWTGSAAYKR
jgi:uncharacterized RDD family membrane protein YckC